MNSKFDEGKTLAMVKGIALRIKKCECPMEFNALVSEGWQGAIQAWDSYNKYNIKRASYYSYAQHRVRGMILDALRKFDPLPARSPIKRYQISMDEPYVYCDDYQEGTKLCLHDILPSKEESVLDRLEREDLVERAMNVINNGVLTEQERFVMLCRYIDDMTLRETGILIHVSESRISQVHTGALKKVRREFKKGK